MRLRIYPKISLLLFAAYLLPVTIVFVVMTYVIYEQRLKVGAEVAETATLAHIERQTDANRSLQADLSLVGSNNQFLKEFAELSALEPDLRPESLETRVRKHLEEAYFLIERHNSVLGMELVDASGRVEAKFGNAPRELGVLEEVPLSAADFEVSSLTKLYLFENDVRVLEVSQKLFTAGKLLGILRLHLYQQVYEPKRLGLGDDGSLQVLGALPSGKVYKYAVTKAEGSQPVLSFVDDPSLLKLFEQGMNAPGETTIDRLVGREGTKYLAAARPLEGTGWLVVSKLSYGQVLGPFVTRAVTSGLWLFVVGLVLVTLANWVFGNSLSMLSDKVGEFLAKNPQFKPPKNKSKTDELAFMTNTMVEIINHMERSRNRLRLAMQDTSRELSDREQQLRTLDEELVQSAKLAAVGEVTSGLAHELNQPLAALRLKLESLRRVAERRGSEEVVKELDESLTYVARLTKLTTSLRGISRASDQQMTKVPLAEVISRSTSLFEFQFQEMGIKLVHPIAPTSLYVYGNQEWVEQVAINLLANARDALEGVENPKIEIEGKIRGQDLILTITDNGPGVPEELRDKIFAPFFTSKASGSGTGLGLSISRRLVERMGGSIDLDQGYEGGARFIVTLKLAP